MIFLYKKYLLNDHNEITSSSCIKLPMISIVEEKKPDNNFEQCDQLNCF